MRRRGASTVNFRVSDVPDWRRRAVLSLLGLGATGIVGRAAYLQVFGRDRYVAFGEQRHISTIELEAHRGAILDRRGEPLALSAPADLIWAIPEQLLVAPEALEEIARFLGRSPDEFRAFLAERGNPARLVALSDVHGVRQLSPEVSGPIAKVGGKALRMTQGFARYYPAAEVTGQLVGFCDVDGKGQAGIEAAQERRLAGVSGTQKVTRDGRRKVIEYSDEITPARRGTDASLTIDLRLQYLAQRELAAAVSLHKAKGGMAIVADAETGDIYALASQPDFNPNVLAERRGPATRERPIVDSFEPGSTIKPLLVAQALELGAFDQNSRIDTGKGYYRVARHTVRDVNAYGVCTLERILTKSSNVGAVKIGERLGAKAVHDGYGKFGIGEPSYLSFPGEPRPLLRDHSVWRDIDLVTASYGYGFTVNGLCMVRAYAALANDGLMPQLRLLTDDPVPPPIRAVSARTARMVREMMKSVISAEGTARLAAIPNYQVAGKTGTVRKVSESGGYAERRYQSAFCGMVPADRPRLVGLVMIDEPDAKTYFGGLVAAPTFSTVMQAALRLFQIAPDGARTAPPNDPGLPVRTHVAMDTSGPLPSGGT